MLSESYDLIMSVCFEVRGKNLDSRQVNPLLREFRRKLENYRLKENGIQAWPERVDEFQSELVGTDLAICSQQIKWNIFNPTGTGYDKTQTRLFRDMLEMKLDNQEKHSKNIITITMKDAIRAGDLKHGRWPRERMETIVF